jgi:hypothetical protein
MIAKAVRFCKKTRQKPKNTRKEEHFGRPRRALFLPFCEIIKNYDIFRQLIEKTKLRC